MCLTQYRARLNRIPIVRPGQPPRLTEYPLVHSTSQDFHHRDHQNNDQHKSYSYAQLVIVFKSMGLPFQNVSIDCDENDDGDDDDDFNDEDSNNDDD